MISMLATNVMRTVLIVSQIGVWNVNKECLEVAPLVFADWTVILENMVIGI